jgi:hypothetical protein
VLDLEFGDETGGRVGRNFQIFNSTCDHPLTVIGLGITVKSFAGRSKKKRMGSQRGTNSGIVFTQRALINQRPLAG